jgi:hypothetical protein
MATCWIVPWGKASSFYKRFIWWMTPVIVEFALLEQAKSR